VLPRVLAVSSSTDNGGSQRHAVTLAADYQALGGSVVIACPPGSFIETTSQRLGVQTVPFQLRNSGDLSAVRTLAQLIRDHDAQVLHSHARRDFVAATLAGKLARCPVLLHVHVVRPLGEPAWLAGRFFNQASGIIAVSEFTRRELEQWHGLRPGLVHRIYNGVDPQVFIQATSLRAEWQIPESALVIGMVGRLTTKGQEGFLPIAGRLAQQYPQLHFVFVGPDGPELRFADFQQKLAAEGLEDRSTVVGVSDQVPRVMRSLDILVHLPTDEAFGLALIEAAAAGVPVVASNIGGCREVVVEQQTGFLVPPNAPQETEQALIRLLDNSTLRQTLGAAGQCRVQSEFSSQRQLTDLCALYQEVTR
jgi:glycosyltransferase involved in cell wall biosynthesis